MLAAPRMVRIDRAVRPCLPMTLPRSLGATRNSSTVLCSPSSALTWTCSGSSTRALAISSTSDRMSPPCSFAILRLLHLRGAYAFGLRFLRRLLCCRGAGRRSFFEQTGEGGRELRTLRAPVIDALTLHVE